VQVALVSWGGETCADADHAGVGARIAPIASWIDEQICRLSAMPPASCDPKNTISYNHRLPPEPPIASDAGTTNSQDGGSDIENFDLKISIQHDISAEYTSWSFRHLESYTLLYWQPFRFSTPHRASHTYFPNLVAGKYQFEISGMNFDEKSGFGPGFMKITNECLGETLWEHWGVFKDYMSVTLELNHAGAVVNIATSEKWVNPAGSDDDTKGER